MILLETLVRLETQITNLSPPEAGARRHLLCRPSPVSVLGKLAVFDKGTGQLCIGMDEKTKFELECAIPEHDKLT